VGQAICRTHQRIYSGVEFSILHWLCVGYDMGQLWRLTVSHVVCVWEGIFVNVM
jgi:hypothetical protein